MATLPYYARLLEYEKRKAQLPDTLTPKQYEAAIARIAKETGV